MSGPRWDPDSGRWVLGDESSPVARRGRRRSVEVMDRSDGDVALPARDLSPEDLVAGIVFPAVREPGRRSAGTRDHPRPMTERDDLARRGAGRIDHGSRRGRRRAPESAGPGAPSSDRAPGGSPAEDPYAEDPYAGDPYAEDPYAGGARPTGTVRPRPHPVRRPPTVASPPGHGHSGRARHGGRRRAEDRAGSRYGLGGFAAAGPGDDLDPWDGPGTGTGPDLGAARSRPVDRAPETTWDARGLPLVEARPADPHDLGYDPRDLDLDLDLGTDTDTDDIGVGPGDRPEDPPRRGRRRAVRAEPRRRRWPWVVGVAAAAAAVVPIGFAVFGGTGDETPAAWREGSVAFGRSSGGGQPGVVPAADTPVADIAPNGAPAPDAAAGASGEVTFEANGSGTSRMITFGGGSSVGQASEVPLPWRRAVPASDEPAEYSVTASGGDGEISCRILADGAVLSEETAGSGYSAVSCVGRR